MRLCDPGVEVELHELASGHIAVDVTDLRMESLRHQVKQARPKNLWRTGAR